MAYVINVARKASVNRGLSSPPRHVFRTAPDSIQTREDAIQICKELKTVYHADEYEISLTREETIGTYILWEDA